MIDSYLVFFYLKLIKLQWILCFWGVDTGRYCVLCDILAHSFCDVRSPFSEREGKPLRAMYLKVDGDS